MEGLKKHYLTKECFPLVISPLKDNLLIEQALLTLRENEVEIKAELLKHGAILFRGFPVQNAEDFSAFIQNANTGEFIQYVGGDSPRKKIAHGIYTSTEAPSYVKIPLHNELSYIERYPSHIYFYCDIEPIIQGETPIADARKVYRSIDRSVLERFVSKKLHYISCYPRKSFLINKLIKYHKSWMDVFETESKEEVERKCRGNQISYQWHANDWIEISQDRPSITIHPQTKEKVWFNQAHIFQITPRFIGLWRYLALQLLYFKPHTRLHSVYFGDKSTISNDDIYHIMDKLEENTLSIPWKKGDVMMLDNVLAMHGRSPFSGKRRILTGMTGAAIPLGS